MQQITLISSFPSCLKWSIVFEFSKVAKCHSALNESITTPTKSSIIKENEGQYEKSPNFGTLDVKVQDDNKTTTTTTTTTTAKTTTTTPAGPQFRLFEFPKIILILMDFYFPKKKHTDYLYSG